MVTPTRKWDLRVKTKSLREKWVQLIEQQRNKLRAKVFLYFIYIFNQISFNMKPPGLLQNNIILDGVLEIKQKNNETWQKRYFVLRNKKLFYCKESDKSELDKYQFIDLHNIASIDGTYSEYIKENNAIL